MLFYTTILISLLEHTRTHTHIYILYTLCSKSIHIYIFIFYICMYVYIYIYIHTYTDKNKEFIIQWCVSRLSPNFRFYPIVPHSHEPQKKTKSKGSHLSQILQAIFQLSTQPTSSTFAGPKLFRRNSEPWTNPNWNAKMYKHLEK